MYTYSCGNIINTNDERTHFFRKIYLSHLLWKGCVCERWVGDWTDCNILTPSYSVFSSTSFSFCWTAQPGVLRVQALCWELVLIASNSNKLTPTQWTCLWHWVIKLFDAHLLLVSVEFAPNSNRLWSRLYLDTFDWMHLFLDWWLGRRSICYNHF